MKDYKRLTKKHNMGKYWLSCDACPVKDNTNCESYDCKGIAFQRLGELEDKIEQGLLFELPCKVGDTVYMPWEYDGVSGVAELTVNDIFLDLNIGSSSIQTNLESDVAEYMRRYRYGLFEFNEVGKKIFLTKEEAEARLQELRGGK